MHDEAYLVLLKDQGTLATGTFITSEMMRVTYMMDGFEFEDTLENDEYQIIGYVEFIDP